MLDGLERSSKLGGQLDATSRKEQQQHTSLGNEVNVDAMFGDEMNQITSSAALAGCLLRRILHVGEPSDTRGKEGLKKKGQRIDSAIRSLGNPGRV
jgi:hypothetical protein